MRGSSTHARPARAKVVELVLDPGLASPVAGFYPAHPLTFEPRSLIAGPHMATTRIGDCGIRSLQSFHRPRKLPAEPCEEALRRDEVRTEEASRRRDAPVHFQRCPARRDLPFGAARRG